MSNQNKLSVVERIKTGSDGLRGTIRESLQDEITGAIREDDQAVIKFHGMYQQDDRDQREERAEKKLDRLYTFMIRLRLPGGFLTAPQWVAANEIADAYSTGIIKVTTRQTIQLHGLIKSDIRPTIQAFNLAKLDSIATCGDINRNVLCSAHPKESPMHAEVFTYADEISKLLMPKTRAYYEIWLDEEKLADKQEEADPLYEDRYLPRKFKIAIAIPPNNDVDVLANDIGLIAIIKDGELKGFNIAVGGGLAATHGNADTYPRLGSVIAFTDTKEKTLKAVYEILTIQRDYGNRSDRKFSRLKYTVDKYGTEWFRDELERRVGFALGKPEPYTLTSRHDHYGWHQGGEGLWYYTAFVENGRVLDSEEVLLKTALLKVAKTGKSNFLFSAQQNVIISDVAEADKAGIDEILERYRVLEHTRNAGSVRKNAMACVALNTCPLALAEGQRYLPELVTKVEELLGKYDLSQQGIIMRMTGCPNGCARPYVAEIGLVGTSYGHYNLHLGGDQAGTRLNRMYKQALNETGLLAELDTWFGQYASEKTAGETFGDFTLRKIWGS